MEEDGMGLLETAEALRRKGWILESEAWELLGLPKGASISWDLIEYETIGADRNRWVKVKKGRVQGLSGPRTRGGPENSGFRVQGTGGTGFRDHGGRSTTDDGRPESGTDDFQWPKMGASSKKWAEWVTVGEAMEILGVCRATIYRHVRYGRFQAYKEGREWRVRRADLEKRLGENWYEERDAENRRRMRPKMRPYRRDGVPLVSKEEVELCMPYYGWVAIDSEKKKVAAWRERFGRGNYDYAVERDWRDEPLDEKRVMTTKQAAEALEIAVGTVLGLARRGKLTCLVVGSGSRRRALYSREQVERLAEDRRARDWRRGKTPGEWAHDLMHPYIRSKIEAPPGDRLITRAEAAGILGVSRLRVSELVRQGRLFGWQAHAGRSGSPLWLSRNQVNRYAGSWDRLRRRAWLKGTAVEGEHKAARIRGIPTDREQFMEWRGLPEEGDRKLQLDHGEYFSTAQVARELGISRTCVGKLRKRGVLMGYHLRRPPHPENYKGQPWWFYLKEDVWRLKLDSEYVERRDRAQGRGVMVSK